MQSANSIGKEVIFGVIPAKSNSYTVGRVSGVTRIVKSNEMRRYEREFIKQCVLYKGALIDQPFTLVLAVYYPDYIHDLDNALKGVLDCLQYVGAIVNDNLCTRIEATRHHDTQHPRIEFELIVPNKHLKLFD